MLLWGKRRDSERGTGGSQASLGETNKPLFFSFSCLSATLSGTRDISFPTRD